MTASGSKNLKTYLARPAGDGPWPGVVVLHEAWGLNDDIRRQADRLAAAGYLALAVDLYSDGGLRCVAATMTAMARGKGKAFTDIETARQMLSDNPDCTGRVGVIGFCQGGGFALLVANRGFDAAASNYGIVPRDLEKTMTDACPVVGSYGGKDLMIPTRAVKRLDSTLERLGVTHDIKIYPNVGHSFLNGVDNAPGPIRPILRVANIKPDPESAADAWERIEAFFAATLAGD